MAAVITGAEMVAGKQVLKSAAASKQCSKDKMQGILNAKLSVSVFFFRCVHSQSQMDSVDTAITNGFTDVDCDECLEHIGKTHMAFAYATKYTHTRTNFSK